MAPSAGGPTTEKSSMESAPMMAENQHGEDSMLIEIDAKKGKDINDHETKEGKEDASPFGPWMLVKHPPRIRGRSIHNGKAGMVAAANSGSRFNALINEKEEKEVVNHVQIVEAEQGTQAPKQMGLVLSPTKEVRIRNPIAGKNPQPKPIKKLAFQQNQKGGPSKQSLSSPKLQVTKSFEAHDNSPLGEDSRRRMKEKEKQILLEMKILEKQGKGLINSACSQVILPSAEATNFVQAKQNQIGYLNPSSKPPDESAVSRDTHMEVASMKVDVQRNVGDLLSNLPDEILGHIVSFLPNEFSLETNLLSTRWRDLWNKTIVRYGTAEDFTDVVATFLTRFEVLDPLKHPRKLQFHIDEDNVLLATIASNGKLLLDFSPWKKEMQMQYELQFKLNKQHITYLSSPSTFLVKTLYLKSVNCFTSDVASSVVSNLEHLEKLVIVECSGLQSLSIDSKSKLHMLTIIDSLQLKSLHLKTSKLKSFRYRGPLPLIWPEYHFNLSEGMLDFRLGPNCSNFKSTDFDATLLTIKNAEVLTLCQWTFEALIWPSISPMSGSFKFYNLRELCWIAGYKDEHNMDALICFLGLCPALEQLFVTIDPKRYSAERSNSSSMYTNTKQFTNLDHLKVISLMRFTSRVGEISLAKKIIQLAKGKPPKIKTSDGSYLDALFMP
ncbi:hypothetical protein RIF29_14110 [Crotalaria pallida]|uniref:F-box domain-containing protein n=1 Tax=Crotalaria pallida TaxID=3830 RepID=A0AAN9FCR6_CROPI